MWVGDHRRAQLQGGCRVVLKLRVYRAEFQVGGLSVSALRLRVKGRGTLRFRGSSLGAWALGLPWFRSWRQDTPLRGPNGNPLPRSEPKGLR